MLAILGEVSCHFVREHHDAGWVAAGLGKAQSRDPIEAREARDFPAEEYGNEPDLDSVDFAELQQSSEQIPAAVVGALALYWLRSNLLYFYASIEVSVGLTGIIVGWGSALRWRCAWAITGIQRPIHGGTSGSD